MRWRGETASRRACSSHGEGRRELLSPGGRDGLVSLPVEMERRRPWGPRRQDTRAAASSRRAKSGMIEIELDSGSRVRVDSAVNADALRRVLSVLSER